MRAADRLLLVACGALVLAGPLMALQEYAHWRETQGFVGVGDLDAAEASAADTGFRDLWQLVMLILVLVVGVLGSLQLVRVLRSPRLRPMSGRLLALLVVGMALLDLSFLLDRAAWTAASLLRAVSVVWFYPLSAAVVALSSARLSELEDAFERGGEPAADAAQRT